VSFVRILAADDAGDIAGEKRGRVHDQLPVRHSGERIGFGRLVREPDVDLVSALQLAERRVVRGARSDDGLNLLGLDDPREIRPLDSLELRHVRGGTRDLLHDIERPVRAVGVDGRQQPTGVDADFQVVVPIDARVVFEHVALAGVRNHLRRHRERDARVVRLLVHRHFDGELEHRRGKAVRHADLRRRRRATHDEGGRATDDGRQCADLQKSKRDSHDRVSLLNTDADRTRREGTAGQRKR